MSQLTRGFLKTFEEELMNQLIRLIRATKEILEFGPVDSLALVLGRVTLVSYNKIERARCLIVWEVTRKSRVMSRKLKTFLSFSG